MPEVLLPCGTVDLSAESAEPEAPNVGAPTRYLSNILLAQWTSEQDSDQMVYYAVPCRRFTQQVDCEYQQIQNSLPVFDNI